jgi:hypothetical protein
MFRLVLSIASAVLAIHLVACSANPPPIQTTTAPEESLIPASPTMTATLVIDSVEVKSHRLLNGPWYACSQATAGTAESTSNLSGKAFSGNEASLDMGLQLSPVVAGMPVQFSLLLDKEPGRACGAEEKDRSTDIFAAGDGETTVSRDGLQYVIHYHMHYLMM